jgi:hypothetical protein
MDTESEKAFRLALNSDWTFSRAASHFFPFPNLFKKGTYVKRLYGLELSLDLFRDIMKSATPVDFFCSLELFHACCINWNISYGELKVESEECDNEVNSDIETGNSRSNNLDNPIVDSPAHEVLRTVAAKAEAMRNETQKYLQVLKSYVKMYDLKDLHLFLAARKETKKHSLHQLELLLAANRTSEMSTQERNSLLGGSLDIASLTLGDLAILKRNFLDSHMLLFHYINVSIQRHRNMIAAVEKAYLWGNILGYVFWGMFSAAVLVYIRSIFGL